MPPDAPPELRLSMCRSHSGVSANRVQAQRRFIRVSSDRLGRNPLADLWQRLATAFDTAALRTAHIMIGTIDNLSRGVILAGEVGLGKTIKAALAISQRWICR